MHFFIPGGYQSETEELSYVRNEGNLVSACFSAHSIFTDTTSGPEAGVVGAPLTATIGHF